MQGRSVKNIKPEEKWEPLSQSSAVLKELREQRLISLFEDSFPFSFMLAHLNPLKI